MVEILDDNGEPMRDRWGRPITSCVIVDETSGRTSQQIRDDQEADKLAQIKARLLDAVRNAKAGGQRRNVYCSLTSSSSPSGCQRLSISRRLRL